MCRNIDRLGAALQSFTLLLSVNSILRIIWQEGPLYPLNSQLLYQLPLQNHLTIALQCQLGTDSLIRTVKRPLDGQYFCTIFEVVQWYWTFVGTIEWLCNVIDGIKTFWNILRNLEILCRLWVVLRNILSVLLFHFSLFFFIHCYLLTLHHFGHIESRIFGCIPEGCVFLLLCSHASFVKFTDLILWYMNLMNNGQIDHGNENPTQHLPWWLRITIKNLSQFGRHQDLPNTT